MTASQSPTCIVYWAPSETVQCGELGRSLPFRLTGTPSETRPPKALVPAARAPPPRLVPEPAAEARVQMPSRVYGFGVKPGTRPSEMARAVAADWVVVTQFDADDDFTSVRPATPWVRLKVSIELASPILVCSQPTWAFRR